MRYEWDRRVQINVQSSYQNVVNLQYSLLDLRNDKTAVEVTESKSNKLKSLYQIELTD